MRIMKLMRKILTLGLTSLLLGQITSLAAAERYEAVNPAYAFSEKTNWRGGDASVSVAADGMTVINKAPYGTVGSGFGFAKNLTADSQPYDGTNDIQALRLYVKNPGADVGLYFQFADLHHNTWWQYTTIKGGSQEYVAYDFPMKSFTYRYNYGGADYEIVARDSTWEAAENAGTLKPENRVLWSVNFTFGTAETDIALSFSKLDRVYETDTPPAPSSSDTSSTPSSDGNDSQAGEDSSLAPSGSPSDTPKPGTGDRTAVLPLTAALFTAAGVMAVVLIKRRPQAIPPEK